MTWALPQKGADHLLALDRVALKTLKPLKLGQEAVVLIPELPCSLPGCPPLDTVAVFWTPDGVRHRFKIFKPVVQITDEDLPYEWLMRSLIAPEGFDEDCC